MSLRSAFRVPGSGFNAELGTRNAEPSVHSLLGLKPCDRDRLGGHAYALGLQVRERVLEPVHVIALGEILAIVAAAALFTRQRAGGDQLGAVQHEAKLERLHQVGVEGPSVILDGDPRVALLERADTARRLLQALAVSDHEPLSEP